MYVVTLVQTMAQSAPNDEMVKGGNVMNEETARLEASREWPLLKWSLACPVLPSENSKIESASWLVLEHNGEYIALVDGGPGSQLYKRQ